MRVNPLRTYNLVDVGDHLVHFAGRQGGRLDPPDGVPAEIVELTPADRLARILSDERISAWPTFGTGSQRVSCFTEAAPSSIRALIHEGRYTPHGIGFTRQFIFDRGGEPVRYVRGDRWQCVTPDDKAIAVRYWPGAVPDPGEGELADHLSNRSEWLHEREWRLRGDLVFNAWDVVFLIVPEAGFARRQANAWRVAEHDERAAYWEQVAEIVLSDGGDVIDDPLGLFS